MAARRTLNRYYLYVFLNSFQFTFTTWLAFVLSRGGNPGWAEAAFHLGILVSEVPTGVVADLMGRRTSMLVGLFLGAAISLSHLLIQGTWSALLVLFLSGSAMTFMSGADSALLYETAEAVGGEELARKAMARANALQLTAMAISPAIAGLLYQWHDWAPFVGRAIVALCVVPIVWGMTEKRAEHTAESRPTMWGQTRTAVQIVMARPTVITLMLFGWVYNTATAMGYQYGQAYFPYTGLAMGAVGFIFAAGNAISTGGSALAERLAGSAAGRVLRFGPVLMGLAYVGMGLFGGSLPALLAALPALGIASFLLMSAVDGVLYPLYQAKFNAEIPNAQRATILSLQSAGFSMLMTMAFPAASYLQPIPMIYLVTGAVTMLLGAIWMLRRWSY